jgi:transcriptional regulator with XRE-family HTH domain
MSNLTNQLRRAKMTKQYPTPLTVAEFIADRLAQSDKTQRQVAQEIGFDNPNVISMFKKGQMKLPINRIEALAKALDADPIHLLRLVMLENLPESWAAIENIMKSTVLTANELELVRAFREVTGDADAQAVVIDRSAVIAIVTA